MFWLQAFLMWTDCVALHSSMPWTVYPYKKLLEIEFLSQHPVMPHLPFWTSHNMDWESVTDCFGDSINWWPPHSYHDCSNLHLHTSNQISYWNNQVKSVKLVPSLKWRLTVALCQTAIYPSFDVIFPLVPVSTSCSPAFDFYLQIYENVIGFYLH